MASILFENVGLDFPVYGPEERSLRTAVKNIALQSRMGKSSKGGTVVKGLQNISFSLEEGDRVGLVGPNGAGKTTLLKLISGIYSPSRGKIEKEGTVTTLFDIGLGMEEDATGVENIYLASYLRGLSKFATANLVDDILEFADLGAFAHLPIRVYSAGMRTRLAFAISTAFVPDILLIDEVFGAGDSSFIHRSEKRMAKLLSEAKILMFASHSNELIRTFCSKGMFMEDGHLRHFGTVESAISAYETFQESTKPELHS